MSCLCPRDADGRCASCAAPMGRYFREVAERIFLYGRLTPDEALEAAIRSCLEETCEACRMEMLDRSAAVAIRKVFRENAERLPRNRREIREQLAFARREVEKITRRPTPMMERLIREWEDPWSR